MRFRYGQYAIESDLRLFPLVVFEGNINAPDIGITVHKGGLSIPEPVAWLHHYEVADGEVFLSLGKHQETHVLRFPNLATIMVSVEEGAIECFPENSTSENTLVHLLLDQVIPRVLSMLGQVVIHAGGVDVDGNAIVLLGQSGWGKSTLTAYFDQTGCPCLTDDALLLIEKQARFYTTLTYPSLRLWPESAEAVFDNRAPHAPVAQYHRKQRHQTSNHVGNHEQSLPISAAFRLAKPREEITEVTISPLSPQRAVMELIDASFRLDWTDQTLLSREIEMFARFVEQTPFYQISYPHDYACLAKVQETIFATL